MQYAGFHDHKLDHQQTDNYKLTTQQLQCNTGPTLPQHIFVSVRVAVAPVVQLGRVLVFSAGEDEAPVEGDQLALANVPGGEQSLARTRDQRLGHPHLHTAPHRGKDYGTTLTRAV